MSREPARVPRVTQGANKFHDSSLHQLLHQCFEEEILPNGLGQFRHSEIQPAFYSSNREWSDYVDFGAYDDPMRHEAYLHDLFWKPNKGDIVICAVAPVGTGKSTFIDYYLRCYCPERKPTDFAKKLIIRINAKGLGDQHSARTNLYYATQDAIESAIKARPGILEPTATKDVAQWVRLALKSLTAAKAASSPPFEYIVLVLDNLEQCSVDAQHKVIAEIESWRELDQVKFWRIIIPLWPSSLRALRTHDFSLLRGAYEFEMGELKVSAYRERLKCVDDMLVSQSMSNAFAHDCREFVTFVFGVLEDTGILRFVRRITHGDLRRELSIVGDFIASDLADRHWTDSKRLSQYEVMSSILLGKYDFFNHDSSRIGNMLNIGHDHKMPRDMLVGWHLLHKMKAPMSRINLRASMSKLGYSVDNTDRALENMRLLNVYHDLVGNNSGDITINPHPSVVNAYLKLLGEPAYIDAIAVTTPVEIDPYCKRMRDAIQQNDGDFIAKVECSLTFIESVRADEKAFVSERRADLSVRDFCAALDNAALPCLWRLMAKKYRGRLTGLMMSGSMPSVSEEMWQNWLKRAVLVDCRDCPEQLTCSK